MRTLLILASLACAIAMQPPSFKLDALNKLNTSSGDGCHTVGGKCVAPYPGNEWLHPKIHQSPDCLHLGGWHDVAGALTFKGEHHVFQALEPPSRGRDSFHSAYVLPLFVCLAGVFPVLIAGRLARAAPRRSGGVTLSPRIWCTGKTRAVVCT